MSNAADQAAQWRAKRYAIKFDPPCVFLEYEDGSLKRRVRAVRRGAQLGADAQLLPLKRRREDARERHAAARRR